MHRFLGPSAIFVAIAITASACSVTTRSAPETTTTVASGLPGSELPLLSDGLGPFRFGDRSDIVLDGLTAAIGGWDADSLIDDQLAVPVCSGRQARIVSWGSLLLTFVTVDADEAFTGWSYGFDPLTGSSDDLRRLGLETPLGIGLGSTRGALLDAFGADLAIDDDETIDAAVFIVTGPGRTQLGGKLDAAGTNGVVDYLETSPGC